MPPLCKAEGCSRFAPFKIGNKDVYFCPIHVSSTSGAQAKPLVLFCATPGCFRVALWGWPGPGGRQFCLAHALPEMSKLKPEMLCNWTGCEDKGTYSWQIGSKRARCETHKSPGMIDLKEASLLCDVLACKKPRLASQKGWRAYCCEEHASATNELANAKRLCQSLGCTQFAALVRKGKEYQYCEWHLQRGKSEYPLKRKREVENAEVDELSPVLKSSSGRGDTYAVTKRTKQEPSPRQPRDPDLQFEGTPLTGDSTGEASLEPGLRRCQGTTGERGPAMVSPGSIEKAWEKARQQALADLNPIANLIKQRLAEVAERLQKNGEDREDMRAKLASLKEQKSDLAKKELQLQKEEAEELLALEAVLAAEQAESELLALSAEQYEKRKVKRGKETFEKASARIKVLLKNRVNQYPSTSDREHLLRLRRALVDQIRLTYADQYTRVDRSSLGEELLHLKQAVKDLKASSRCYEEERQRLFAALEALEGA